MYARARVCVRVYLCMQLDVYERVPTHQSQVEQQVAPEVLPQTLLLQRGLLPVGGGQLALLHGVHDREGQALQPMQTSPESGDSMHRAAFKAGDSTSHV